MSARELASINEASSAHDTTEPSTGSKPATAGFDSKSDGQTSSQNNLKPGSGEGSEETSAPTEITQTTTDGATNNSHTTGNARFSDEPAKVVNGADDETEAIDVDNRESVKHLVFLDEHEKAYEEQMERLQQKVRDVLLDPRKASASYLKNNHAEELCLGYVSNFRRQYTQLYPGRKELLLTPKNEFGVQKFVSTTLRPSQLSFTEVYDYRGCAKFVADHLAYRPFEVPYDLPSTVPSPTYTLQLQSGNSLDFSMVLASLLIGVGYDAYVVSGYATRRFSERDERFTELPIERNSLEDESHLVLEKQEMSARKAETNAIKKINPDDKYRVKPIRELKSSFITKQAEKEAARQKESQQDGQKEAAVKPLEDFVPQEADEFEGLRVHFWVMVLPGERDVADAFFIEPSTGKVYPVDHTDYLGVESVFNAKNYWVNMQTCFNGLKGISFDLGDNSKWDFVYLANSQNSKILNKDDKTAAENGSRGGLQDDEEVSNSQTKEVLDVPPSWVNRLDITKEKFELRTPNGSKKSTYKNANLELFAPYIRRDGMVQRLTIFENLSMDQSFEIRETFENRKYRETYSYSIELMYCRLDRDKLVRRLRIPSKNLVVEYFEQGRTYSVKELILVDLKVQEIRYFDEGRVDGLVKRIEQPSKTVEFFRDRDDKMVYRSARFDRERNQNLPITDEILLKLTEKFSPNHEIPSGASPKKRTYYIRDERFHVIYHLEDGRIFPAFEEFRKPGTDQKLVLSEFYHYYQTDSLAKPRPAHEAYSRYEAILKAEQMCNYNAKAADREMKEFLQARVAEEKDVVLVVSPYDTTRNAAKLSMDKEMGEIKSKEEELKAMEVDYLSAYLVNVNDPNNLTKEEALRVRDECMKGLKERLIEKATIIQARNDGETAAYQRRQVEFQRHQDAMSPEDHEEYRNFCNDTLFRIHILERRLNKHKESAPEKYIALDKKLRTDPRIARFL